MLTEQHPDIVSICTPDDTHVEYVRAAILADTTRAVFAEKPLAMTVEDARELHELADQRGVVLAVNYIRRYAEPICRVRDYIQSGVLGVVHTVTGLYTKGTLHNGTHWFDLARFLVGETVEVLGWDRIKEGGDDPTLDVHLEFGHGGRADLYACSANDFTVFEMDIIATRGRVRLIESTDVVEFFDRVEDVPYSGYRSLILRNRQEGVLRDTVLRSVEDMVLCIRTGAAPRCGSLDGVRALEIASAARESALLCRAAL